MDNERYRRQLSLKEFGMEGQRNLLNAKILMVGAGGLGCAALPYLAAAGVGTIGIADNDRVALHNLQRQVLYTVSDIGLSKTLTAVARLAALNPDITLVPHELRVNVDNALELISRYDLVIDGTDNFMTRYLLNDACVLLGKPLIYGAVSKFEGQVAVFNFRREENQRPVNYRDVFPIAPAPGEIPNCEEAGVLGVLPGIIGTLQATEAIKILTGLGSPLAGKLFTYNALTNQSYELLVTPASDAEKLMPATVADFQHMDYESFCGQTADALEIGAVDFENLRKQTDLLLLDVREPHELPELKMQSLRVPLAELETGFEGTDKRVIVTICQTGKRSLRAAKILAGKYGGTKKIYSLAGGLTNWKA